MRSSFVLTAPNGTSPRSAWALRSEPGVEERWLEPSSPRIVTRYLLNDFVKSSAVVCTTFFSWRELAMSSLSLFSHA